MAREQLSQEVKHLCNLIGMMLHTLEEGTIWSNHAEVYIKLIKEVVCKDMREANLPLVFWDYCLKCCVRIYNLTVLDHHKVHGNNPYTAMTGEEGDISSVSQYGWYQWCYLSGTHQQFSPQPRGSCNRSLAYDTLLGVIW